jgi:hypothetical protein
MVLDSEDLFPQTEPSKEDTKPLTAVERMLLMLPVDDPLREVIKPLRPASTTIEDIIKEQNYKGTDWDKLNAIARDMAIAEPIELLLAQLKD